MSGDIYLAARVCDNVDPTVSSYNEMVKNARRWNEIVDMASKNPIVKHHLNELLTAVKLVKGI